MARVLVVEDSPVQARFIELLMAAGGHAVEVVGHGVAALAAARRAAPDVILTDMVMPEMSGLDLIDAARTEFPGLPVVVTTEFGSEELAVEALKAGAAYYIPKRNLARDAAKVVDEILSVADARKKQALFLDRQTSCAAAFELENDTTLSPLLVGHIESQLQQMNLFDPSIRVHLGVALHEAVVNAMVHGNLEVGSDLKGGDWQAYHALVAERAAREPYKSRRVTVSVRASRAPFLEVSVRDQGPGFDPTRLPDPTDPANLEQACGRGLLLIRTFFDRVSHNATGNEITMSKGTPGAAG